MRRNKGCSTIIAFTLGVALGATAMLPSDASTEPYEPIISDPAPTYTHLIPPTAPTKVIRNCKLTAYG